MAAPAESLAQSNTLHTAAALSALSRMQQEQQMQAQAAAGGAAGAGDAGVAAARSNGGEGSQEEGSEGHEQQRLLELAPHNGRPGASEKLRTISSNLNRIAPNIRKHTPAGHHLKKDGLLRLIGTDAPQPGAEQEPLDYFSTLMEWPLAAAVKADCIVWVDDKPYLDLERLHAAGCFPHAWTFPLTLDGVQAANRQAQAVYNQGPEGRQRLLREALEAASRRSKRPADTPAEEAAEEAPRAQQRRAAQVSEFSGGERQRSSRDTGTAAAHAPEAGAQEAAAAAPAAAAQQAAAEAPAAPAHAAAAQAQEAEAQVPALTALLGHRPAVLQRRAVLLQVLDGAIPTDGGAQWGNLQLVFLAGRGCRLLQGLLDRWDQLTCTDQSVVYEVVQRVAIAHPPAWEQLEENLRLLLPALDGAALPPHPGSAPAAAASPAAAAAEPSPLLQRVQQMLVKALGFDPSAAGPANAEDPRKLPFHCLACYLAQATSPAKDIVERWREYSDARRQWLLDELVLVATEGAWPHAGPRLQAVLGLPEAAL